MTTTDTRLLDAALTYAALGWPVVPLHTPVEGICDCPKHADCESPGKHPRTRNGLADATTDEAKIRRWWGMWPHANIAVALEPADLVDIAPDSPVWHADFIARGLPPTPAFASGGGDGHAHYLYARTDNCPVHRLTLSGEYDILSNGYAVMPPSLHVSGREYVWTEDPATGLSEVPAWAASMLHERADRRAREERQADQEDDPPPVKLYDEDLDRWHGRIFDARPDGRVDRSYSLWRLAVILLTAGLLPWIVERLLADRDSVLGWEKFSDRRDGAERYRIIVEHAQTGVGPGRVRVETRSNGTGHAAEPPPPPGERFLDGATIQQIEDEDVTWIARGYAGVGLVTELDGKVKQSGKTTLATALCRSILTSAPFLDEPTTYTPVVYLTEQSGPSFKRNLRRAGLLGRTDLHILLWNRVTDLKWSQVVALAVARAKEVGAKCLIVDTLGQFSGVHGDSENHAGAALDVLKPLQAAAGTPENPMAVVVLRHDRKAGGDVGDSARGSSAYSGAVDIILRLSRVNTAEPGHERQRILESLSRFEETPARMLIELDEGEPFEYRAIGDVNLIREHRRRTEVLEALPTTPDEALDREQLLQLVHMAWSDLLRVLNQLQHDRDVIRIGAGRQGNPYRYYRLDDDDEDDADEPES